MANSHLSYYDTEEIESAVLDLIDANMMEDAECLAEHGAQLHPNDETVEKILIWIYFHHHKTEQAEAMYQKYCNDGTDWSIRMHFAFTVMHGHPKAALEEFLAALDNHQITSIDWITTIDEMYEAIPIKVLVPYLIKAIDRTNDNAETLGRIGNFLIEAYKFDEAIIALEKALDIDAYDIYSWQDLARAYILKEDVEKCLEACDYGLAIDEQNPLLSFLKGYILFNRKENKECIPALEVARRFAEGKIEPRNFNIPDSELQDQINVTYEMLGNAYLDDEQIDKAQDCFEILLERKPDSIVPYIQLSSIHLLKGDMNQALQYTQKGIEVDPESETVRTLHVSILTSMRDFNGALKSLKKLTQIKPNNHNFLMAYAELSRHIGNDKEADKTYRKLLKLGDLEQSYTQLLRDYFTSIGDDDALKKLEESDNKDIK